MEVISLWAGGDCLRAWMRRVWRVSSFDVGEGGVLIFICIVVGRMDRAMAR